MLLLLPTHRLLQSQLFLRQQQEVPSDCRVPGDKELDVLHAMNAVAGLAGHFQELASQKLLRMLKVQRSCGPGDV